MNFKLVFRVSGKVLLVEAACMLLPLAVALLYGDDPRPLLLSAVVTAAVGGLLSLLRAKTDFFAREGFFTAGQTARELGFGAGMGLPNIKRYSDEMSIETELGKGTTVTVRIKIPQ